MEINLEEQTEPPTVTHSNEKANRLPDLTEHGKHSSFAKAAAADWAIVISPRPREQAPRFAQPGEPGEEGIFSSNFAHCGRRCWLPECRQIHAAHGHFQARPKNRAVPRSRRSIRRSAIVEYPDWHRLHVCDVPGSHRGRAQERRAWPRVPAARRTLQSARPSTRHGGNRRPPALG